MSNLNLPTHCLDKTFKFTSPERIEKFNEDFRENYAVQQLTGRKKATTNVLQHDKTKFGFN
jgi:hypothetical protein